MLVLHRKLHEKILIGDDVCVEITEITRSHVSLGITAPTSVPIRRTEVPAIPGCGGRIPAAKDDELERLRSWQQRAVEVLKITETIACDLCPTCHSAGKHKPGCKIAILISEAKEPHHA